MLSQLYKSRHIVKEVRMSFYFLSNKKSIYESDLQCSCSFPIHFACGKPAGKVAKDCSLQHHNCKLGT